MAVIRRAALTVRASTTCSRPAGANTMPTDPSTRASRECPARPEDASAPLATVFALRSSTGLPYGAATASAQCDIGVQQRDEGREGLRVTRHECRTSLVMNMDRAYEADRNPSAM